MSDWPNRLDRPAPVHISTMGKWSGIGDHIIVTRNGIGQAVWPAANRAIYVPIFVQEPMTIFKLAIYNGVPSGNVDCGLYSYPGTGNSATRLAAAGTTAMAGELKAQIFDITDQILVPGTYFIGAVCSVGATATFSRVAPSLPACRLGGIVQQGLAEAKLPETAAFEAPASGYAPVMAALAKVTV